MKNSVNINAKSLCPLFIIHSSVFFGLNFLMTFAAAQQMPQALA
ncbi:MAG: hypothetical protein OEY25_10680 [Candidatus Aminicenantes bacterium]|nr:hypothetical protein [Candidatus Aminicenantes bacterium]